MTQDDTPSSQNDVAIIGMTGRFPGADNISQFWSNLCEGVESISDFTEEDLLESGIDPARLKEKGYINSAGIIEDIEYFDAKFFNISPKEARLLDPQRRLFLECAWEALEIAGYPPSGDNGYTGVFAGANMSTYLLCNLIPGLELRPPLSDFQLYVGNDKDFFSTYVSYKFDLRGPSISVQTACSSSLVAVHLACQSLLDGQCDTALAGGVGIFHPQKSGFPADEMVIFSRDGRCRAFDADAKGTVLGNGVGIVVLKRLGDAVADRDHIHAVIRGSAINNDGIGKVGYTAPSIQGQSEVVAEALAVAGIEPDEIDYIETHGTGTSVGDLIEITALKRVFGSKARDNNCCAIGSVKTNIGHLWSAAGVAGLIKAVLAVERGLIPPSLNFVKPNPNIDFENSPFRVSTSLSEWSDPGNRKACVSSFGIGGTNAHVVLEQAPDVCYKSDANGFPVHILSMSAKSDEALQELVEHYSIHLEREKSQRFENICYTANTGRVHFEKRLAIIAGSRDEAKDVLVNRLKNGNHSVFSNIAQSIPAKPKIAFVFAGKMTESIDVLTTLYRTQPVIRDVLAMSDRLLCQYSGRSDPLIKIEGTDGRVTLSNDIPGDIAAFVIQYALTRMWMSWGVRPDVVTGAGAGEYVAACVAGVMGLEDALKLLIAEVSNGITPKGSAIEETEEGQSSHLNELVRTITFSKPNIGYVSGINVVSNKEDDVTKAECWHKRLTVKHDYTRTVQYMLQSGVNTVLQIFGCAKLIEKIEVAQAEGKAVMRLLPALFEGQKTWERLAKNLAQLYVDGADIDWKAFYSGSNGYKVALPTYPFQRERYWVERSSRLTDNQPNSIQIPTNEGLRFTRRIRSPLRDVQFEIDLDPRWMELCGISKENQGQQATVPLYMEYAQSAAAEVLGKGEYELYDIDIESNVSFDISGNTLITLVLTPTGEGLGTFQLFAFENTNSAESDQAENLWSLLCTGRCVRKRVTELQSNSTAVVSSVRSRCVPVDKLPVDAELTVPWEIDEVALGEQEALWRLSFKASIPEKMRETYWRSLSLQAAIDNLGLIFKGNGHRSNWAVGSIVSFYAESVTCKQMWIEARWWVDNNAGIYVNLKYRDELGATLMAIDGMHLVPAEVGGRPNPEIEVGDWYYQLRWKNKGIGSSQLDKEKLDGRTLWMVLRHSSGAGSELVRILREHGEVCIEVTPGENYQQTGKDHYQIDPGSDTDFLHLFNDVEKTTQSLVSSRIIHIWGAGVQVSDNQPELSEDMKQRLLTHSALNLVKAAKKSGSLGECKLWFLTSGAQSVGESDALIQPLQRSLWGLGRVIRSECAVLWGGLVDLDPVDMEKNWFQFIEDVCSIDGEDELAYRGDARFTAYLGRLQNPELHAADLDPNGTYLITGGLGGLGLKVAQWMVARGAERLVLMGRSAPSEDAGHTLNELQHNGCEIHIEQVDVCDSSALSQSLDEIGRKLPPVQGIVHAAGIIDDALISIQDWQRFFQVMRPKVLGSWNLHVLTQEYPLEFFVMFSSIAPVLGSPGQANYAAANEFMDGLSLYRHAKGMPAISINWGPWLEAGMAHRLGDIQQQRLTKLGIESILPEVGLSIFGNLLALKQPNVMVLNMDWQKLVSQLPAGQCPPLLKDLLHDAGKQNGILEVSRESEVKTGASPSERNESDKIDLNGVRGFVRKSVSKVLGLKDKELSFDADPIDFGMDSLRFMEVINDVKGQYGITLYPNEFLERPSVNGMAEYIFSELHTVDVISADVKIGKNDKEKLSITTTVQNDNADIDNGIRDVPVRQPCFILSSPRSGSTLLRVMLGANKGLFCPPELHLLPFQNMEDRADRLETYLGEGLERAVMELERVNPSEARKYICNTVEHRLPVSEMYSLLQEAAAPRRLVDKSPSYGASRHTLERAETLFSDAKYILLVRHPYSVIESFVRNRMNRILGLEGDDPYKLAEQVWTTVNDNVLGFLGDIPEKRRYMIRYEDLVRRPETTIKEMCAFLEVPYTPEMLRPYQEGPMIDGVHPSSMSIGDPNFSQHAGIDKELASVWKDIKLPTKLQEKTVKISETLGYELPQENNSVAVHQSDEVQPIVVIQGEGVKPPLFCLHPSGGQVFAYHYFKQVFGEERPIYGIQSIALNDSSLEHSTLESMVEEYSRLITRKYPTGPYYLLGWSLGGRLALAIAGELEQRGYKVAFAGIIDSRYPPNDASSLVGKDVSDVSMAFGGRLIELVAKLPPELKEEVSRGLLDREGEERLKWLLTWAQKHGALSEDLPLEMLYQQASLVDKHVDMLKAHVPQPVECDLHVWWSREGLEWRAATEWGKYTTGCTCTDIINGTHYTMMAPPNVYVLAKQVKEYLERTEQDPSKQNFFINSGQDSIESTSTKLPLNSERSH